MDAGNFIALITTPISGAIGAIIVAALQRPSKEERENRAREEAEDDHIEHKIVELREEEVDASRLSVALDAMQSNIDFMKGRLNIAEAENEKLRARLDTQEKASAEQSYMIRQLDAKQYVYLDHIYKLEKLIPNPPGPPSRPWE